MISCNADMHIPAILHSYVATYIIIQISYVPYMGKIWRGEILANLANGIAIIRQLAIPCQYL